MAASFASLPNELILDVSLHLGSRDALASVASLSATCRHLHALLTPYLYKLAAHAPTTAALCHAIAHDHAHITRLLLCNNADLARPAPPPTSRYDPEDTPLHLAVRHAHAHADVLPLLLLHARTQAAAAADDAATATTDGSVDAPAVVVDPYNARRETPLHVAVKYGFASVAEVLLDAGATACKPANGLHRGALGTAVRYGQAACVEVLVRRGGEDLDAPVSIITEYTALHWAAERGDERVVRLLLEHGADRGVRNREYETPLKVARRKAGWAGGWRVRRKRWRGWTVGCAAERTEYGRCVLALETRRDKVLPRCARAGRRMVLLAAEVVALILASCAGLALLVYCWGTFQVFEWTYRLALLLWDASWTLLGRCGDRYRTFAEKHIRGPYRGGRGSAWRTPLSSVRPRCGHRR